MDVIENAPLFKGLPEKHLLSIKSIAVERRYKNRDMIFFEGDPGDGFYIVKSGVVKIGKISSEGKEQIYHILERGEPFGEVPVFSGDSFPANAEAISDCTVYFFPKDAFVRLISESPSLSLNMLAVLCMRLRQFTLQIEDITLKEVLGRLASYLVRLSGEQKSHSIRLLISKGQLASLLGTIPETLSRGLLKLTNMGIIEVSGREIELNDVEELEKIAAQGK